MNAPDSLRGSNASELVVVSPFDRRPIGAVRRGSWAEADRWLEGASALHRNRSNWLPAYRRIDILKATAGLMKERTEVLALQIAREGGKPLADARVEVARAVDGVELCIKELSHLTGREIPMDLTAAGAGRMAFTAREPIGPVVAVSAFNHPLNLIVHQVAPAVATGCPVIVKPADDTPLSALSFVEMLYEAGLPRDWCKFFPSDIPTAERLVTDPRVAFFSFIGSAGVGWMLRSKLAPGTRCALEHGGAAPVIVDDGADLEAAVPLLTKGGFYHAGQVCVSVQRVFAPNAVARDLAARLGEAAQVLKAGDPTRQDTDVGPLIRPREVARVGAWVDEAIAGGAEVFAGGHALGETLYAPTVLFNPPADAKISTQEIFGPVVAVYGTDGLDEAIARANGLPFAFQAACFTNRLQTAMRCIRELDATAVIVNDHTAFRVDWMPFAGRRRSGLGTGGIGYTMHDMTQDKMAVLRFA